ncbi:MAG: TolC family protein [Acidobacteriota bacterium]
MKRNAYLNPITIALLMIASAANVFSQSTNAPAETGIVSLAKQTPPVEAEASQPTYAQFVDAKNGLSLADLVRLALEHNGELAAARQMIAEARGRLRQAGFKPNPMVEASGTRGLTSADNTLMISGELPLELGGRRKARIAVAQRELEMREAEVADFERKLAAEVRMKYVEAMAMARNLQVSEDLLTLTRNSHRLVKARVDYGKSAPLEQSEIFVEMNRIDASRIGFQAKVEIALLELKKLIGLSAEDHLRLRGDWVFDQPPQTKDEALRVALASRADLIAYRAAEALAAAEIEQARIEGKVDASLFANYQRMNSGFDVFGLNEMGGRVPVQGIFHLATFGVKLTLPVRNKNQGAIEAAIASQEAARKRREFAEIVARNEVAAAYVQFEAAQAAFALYREGVHTQAFKNLEVIRKTYTLGQKSALDYVAEQRRFIEVEMSFTEMMKDYQSSLAEIERVIGAKK